MINVNSNISSIFAQRRLSKSQEGLNKAMARLTTGLRINSAADDAAGLAVGTRMQTQIRSLEQAKRNAGDGISASQTAESSMEQMTDVLSRLRELSIQSSNGALNNGDRSFLHTEFSDLVTELDRLAQNTEFNGIKLLDGGVSAGLTFHVGSGNTANDKITISITNMRANKLGAGGVFLDTQSVSTSAKAQTSLGIIDGALTQIGAVRSKLGSFQNRLGITIDNIGSSVENLSASKARIMDADIAKETAALTRNQILVQAGVSVLAQANQAPQIALSLLG